jgi:hypothetical protein
MATEPPSSTPAEPPKPPGPGATRDEWRAWSRQQRDFVRDRWGGGWYGPWPWGGSGLWPWYFGVALVVIGGYYLLQNLGWLGWLNGHDVLWPILVILLGVLMLVRRGRAW